MDLLLGLAVAFGICYGIIRAARWAFKIDRDEWKTRERLSRKEAHRINKMFEDIAQHLRKDK